MAMFNYESEDIYQQVRGKTNPSSPVYVADCKKEILEEVSPNYPQLVEYEKEWLNFAKHIYHDGTPVPLEYQEVKTDEYATVNNAIPFNYKSAILKGNTLVNKEVNLIRVGGTGWTKTNNVYTLPTGMTGSAIGKMVLEANTKYIVKYLCNSTLTNIQSGNYIIKINTTGNDYDGNIAQHSPRIGENSFTFTTNDITDVYMSLYVIGYEPDNDIKIGNFRVIKYQEGMENWNIPYFTGMQSVKMPVLTTTNADDTKTNILSTPSDLELRGVGDVKDGLDLLTGEVTERIEEVTFNSSNGWVINNSSSSSSFNKVYEFKYPLQRKGKNSMVISNNFVQGDNGDYERVNTYTRSDTTYLYLCIDKSKLSSNSIDALNDYFQSNPITVQYQLETESVKTVDLNQTIKPYEGNNHYQVSSDTIPPQLLLSVPVVSTGNQTLNDIITEE